MTEMICSRLSYGIVRLIILGLVFITINLSGIFVWIKPTMIESTCTIISSQINDKVFSDSVYTNCRYCYTTYRLNLTDDFLIGYSIKIIRSMTPGDSLCLHPNFTYKCYYSTMDPYNTVTVHDYTFEKSMLLISIDLILLSCAISPLDMILRNRKEKIVC